jgi:hypothetical protein
MFLELFYISKANFLAMLLFAVKAMEPGSGKSAPLWQLVTRQLSSSLVATVHFPILIQGIAGANIFVWTVLWDMSVACGYAFHYTEGTFGPTRVHRNLGTRGSQWSCNSSE